MAGNWHYVVWRKNGCNNGTQKIYLDGDEATTNPYESECDWATPTKNFYIGSGHLTTETFNGIIDEVRVSHSIRSADWIKTEYNNQSATSTFYLVNNEEAYSGGSTSATSFCQSYWRSKNSRRRRIC